MGVVSIQSIAMWSLFCLSFSHWAINYHSHSPLTNDGCHGQGELQLPYDTVTIKQLSDWAQKVTINTTAFIDVKQTCTAYRHCIN
uniref:Putative secreted protein n=1 Tax=Ixodes ricinus TaxID=34613 RepID=A0A6B0UAI6_IXORI